jgi:predicted DNA-binding protein
MYDAYIVRRTQIYLEIDQDALLEERARSVGRTKSALIREAIDAYLGNGSALDDAAVARLRVAAGQAHGIAPYLPRGEEYVESLRAGDAEREDELRSRRRS